MQSHSLMLDEAYFPFHILARFPPGDKIYA